MCFIQNIAGVGGPYNITYSYTDAQGCSNSSSKSVSVTAHNDGISKISGLQELLLYPNPSSGRVMLTVQSTGLKMINIRVSDASGKTVWVEENLKVNGRLEKLLNLSGLAKGWYQVSMMSGEEEEQRSIIIE
jgi:hypothetical protein